MTPSPPLLFFPFLFLVIQSTVHYFQSHFPCLFSSFSYSSSFLICFLYFHSCYAIPSIIRVSFLLFISSPLHFFFLLLLLLLIFFSHSFLSSSSFPLLPLYPVLIFRYRLYPPVSLYAPLT